MNNTIYHTITRKKVGATQCITCGEDLTAPPGTPGYCKHHRNNATPLYGWLYVSSQQRDILRLIEEAGLTKTIHSQLTKIDSTSVNTVIQESLAIMSLSESVADIDYIETEI